MSVDIVLSKMISKAWISILLLATTILAVSSQTCPSDHFPAVFASTIQQTLDNPVVFEFDPELNFFKNVLKLRDEELPHVFDEALHFFNYTFGLNFFDSPLNSEGRHVVGNATLGPFIIPDNVEHYVTVNNWISNGNTRSTCYRNYAGGIRVTFTGDQMLYGSYGGDKGKPARPGEVLIFGFYHIDVCKQSPLIIHYRSNTPVRTEPIDHSIVLNDFVINRVLGPGTAQGIAFFKPDPDEPGKWHFSLRLVFTFGDV